MNLELKIFITIQLFAVIIGGIGQYLYWSNTSNWHSNDGGWTHIYNYSYKYRDILRHTSYSAVLISIIGFLILIWSF